MQPQAQAQQGQGQAQKPKIPPWIGAIIRGLVMYFIFSTIGKYVFKGFTSSSTTSTVNGGITLPEGAQLPKLCAFTSGQRLNLFVYLSYNTTLFNETEATLIWEQKDLTYDWSSSNTRDSNTTISITQQILSNSSITAHIFLVKATAHPRPGQHTSQAYFTYQLTEFRPRPKVSGKKNLISGDLSDSDKRALELKEAKKEQQEKEEETKEQQNETWIMYWKPALEMRVLGEAHALLPSAMPVQMQADVPMDFKLGVYWPIFFVNTFWLRQEHWLIVNDTLTSLPLKLHFSPITITKYSFVKQFETQMRQQISLTGGVVDEEMDEFKRIFTETNVYLLAITFIVSTVHTIFDFLAFKNDISFWKSRKSLAGISVKTLMLNTACQVIIFLYLLDNNTSWMILISSGIGLLIEFWKIGKACIVNLIWKKFRFVPFSLPWIKMTDRESYTKSNTKVYDDTAMRYLSYALYPLLVTYAIYSLIYETHKSWYSWILGSLTGAVYTFGFIMMTPQLFINYKLKSVAHLPWRALVYKSLNTFIDDLFAFIIKMPTMHRIACFRDDIVFLVYIYQRWLYPVDRSRVESLQWEDAASDFAEQKESKPTQTSTTTEEKPKSE